MTNAIGKIEVAGLTTAWLDDELAWHCDDLAVLRTLQLHFSDPVSPADGEPGAKRLHDAAEFFGGTATWLAPEPEDEPNVVH